MILTSIGLVKIEDIKVGDKVWSYNEETKEKELKTVKRQFRNKTKEWLHIIVQIEEKEEEIICTPNHRIYIKGKGWIKANEILENDEILVEKAIIRWNASGVIDANAKKVDDYYVFESKLNYGESIKLNITYNKSSFKTLDPNMQFTDDYTTPQQIVLIVCIMAAIVIFVIVIIIISYKAQDPYMSSRGFYGHSYVHHHHWWYPKRRGGYDKHGVKFVNPNTSNHASHGGGGCACACACACAGGGRAGCSLKDFYNTNLQSEKIIKNLKG